MFTFDKICAADTTFLVYDVNFNHFKTNKKVFKNYIFGVFYLHQKNSLNNNEPYDKNTILLLKSNWEHCI